MSKAVIGIDLGATNSCVCVFRNGRPEVIPDEQGHCTMPSFVAFTDTERLVGEAARKQAAINPCNTLFGMKHLIGRKFSDPEVQADIRRLPFIVFKSPDNHHHIRVRYRGQIREFAPEEICAMILKRLKEIAESHLGEAVLTAVVAVPPFFNYTQRQSVRDAGTIAGLNVVGIIDESTAAAVAHGIDTRTVNQRNILVFDMGGSCVGVSLLAIKDGTFEVKATAGNTHFSGQTFDDRLVSHFSRVFQLKHEKDVSSFRALRRLQTACEDARRTLSSSTHATIDIESLSEGIGFRTSLSRSRFEDLCQDLFNSALEPIQRGLCGANLQKSDVDEIVLVGGASCTPRVSRLVSDFFDGMIPRERAECFAAVARGAAIQAAALVSDTPEETRDFILLDVAPVTLGIKSWVGAMIPLVKRNTSIPVLKQSKVFPLNSIWPQRPMRTKHEPSRPRIEFYEGEHPRATHNNLLRRLELSRYPCAPTEIVFGVDGNGLLDVQVSVSGNPKGISNHFMLSVAGGLSREDISRMSKRASDYEAEEKAEAARDIARSSLESYAYDILATLQDLDSTVKETVSWLRNSSAASAEDYQERKAKLEAIIKPRIESLRAYGAGAQLD